MGTFSKSLASLGGYMAASRDVVEYVKHVSRPFIFSASITPASVEAARAALRIIRREPERVKALHDISSYMREGLKKLGVDIIESQTPIIPIYTYEDEKTFIACKLLLERGVYVNPVISPATPPGQSLLRTSYTATHTREQMDHAMRSIKEVLEILKNYA
jgi:7-keto-8-aminopelargonate synthetase-like enzyme